MNSLKTSNDLFNKIRSKFGNITTGDSEGNATANPNEAVFFDFEFTEDQDEFGRVSISLADGESMKVFYNRDLINKIDETSRADWYSFIKELKDFAVEHQLKFDVRDITRSSLNKQDYKNLADTNTTVNTDEMSEELNRITHLAGLEKPAVAEGLTGTSKSSFESLDKTRLIIRHKGKVDETVPGARSRQIQSLYIETEEGERFKYPLIHLAGARAMTRHVANSGRPHDDFGQHIIQTSEDIAKLNSFARYAANKDQLNDSAGDIIEQTKLKLENLRNYVKKLSKQSNYDEASKNFKTPQAFEMDDDTAKTYRDKFTLKNLDNRVEDALPIIHRIMSEYKDGDEKTPAPVDHGALVQSFLANPEKKIVLRKDDTADNMLKVTQFTNKNTMLSAILSDIAARLLTKGDEEDRIANFASRVADEMEDEGEPFFKPTAEYVKNKKIAIQLAKRYINDYKKLQSDPAYADTVRMDPGEYKPKVNRQGQAKDESAQFEQWADDVANQKNEDDGEPIMRDPLDSEQAKDMQRDLDGDKIIFRGKEIDQNSIEYKMVDYSDMMFELNGAKFTDGTELDEKELEELEGMDELIAYVSTDYVTEAEETTTEAKIKPYVSMYQGDGGKMVYDVLNGDGESAMKTLDGEQAEIFLKQNYDKLKTGTPEKQPILSKPYPGSAMLGQHPKSEGNEFAQAVQKAKAAGMKSGDKFKVGDKEYTLKDAIELAGLNLNEFFQEEETEVPAEHDSELDRIKQLANIQ